ncbi:hypothetical protein BZG06_16235 [Salinivibrio kushneri]|uniref:MBL fold metallo-hydrolase n=1 Tax=Salinivibrio kushneri TaxID=1908198 RepID=A0AB36JWN4_9GAMM|nr:MBL fold metallo-hydrolase [Salinivibrio kushneri]OOE38493.1 hypothetical protein BZG06_16235 [Salinivibrio kushneri]OOE39379.1 hypothetical protein BZG09_16885 [Salinivibrio kushneri]
MKTFIQSLCLVMASTLTLSVNAEQVDIQWLGGPTMLIKFGPIQILTDPMLGEGEKAFRMADPNEVFDLKTGPRVKDHKRLTPLPALDTSEVDVIAISHSHEDHFDQVARQNLPKDITSVIPSSDLNLLQSLGFKNIKALTWPEKWQYQEGIYQITITAIPAFHTENHELTAILGDGNGYLFEFRHDDWQKVLYWMGDTFLTPALQDKVQAYGQIDILVPHLGRVGTSGPLGQISMGAKEVIDAVNILAPTHVLPIHHSTYELYLEPVSELVKQAERSKVALDVLAAGGTISYR